MNKADKGTKSLRALTSVLLQRLSLAQIGGKMFGGKRDFYNVFGYERNVTYRDILSKYERQEIAGRVVDAPPDATWSQPPSTDNEDINKVLETLAEERNLWSVMHRADRAARLGRFSLVLIGFNDSNSGDLSQPVGEVNKKNPILYLRPLSEAMVSGIEVVADSKDERFGQPSMYKVYFEKPTARSFNVPIGKQKNRTLKVHWSRIVHVVDNPLEDDLASTPIMLRVYNLLDDIMKVVGGTGEAYWLTGNRGMQADIDKEMALDPDDAEALSDEIEEYQHNLRRFIRTRGVKLNNLGSDTPRPEQTFKMVISMLSGATGIPQRILIGSEAGQLASEQDRANWAERIEERRLMFAEPHMLRPLLKRLQMFGVLPEGKYKFIWPSAFKMNPLEQAQMMAQKGRAIANLSKQTGAKTPMQITSTEEARDLIGLTGPLKDEASGTGSKVDIDDDDIPAVDDPGKTPEE